MPDSFTSSTGCQLSFNHNPEDILRVRKTCSLSGDGRGVTFLKLAGAARRRWLVLGEFAKYAFCGLKRKRRNFERSVLKYVSIKIPALAHSGRKSRVCVNQPDRLTPCHQALLCFPAFLPSSTRQCPRTGQTTNTARPHQAE